ncbi:MULTISPECIES: MFS transporter [Algibacter]|uniref:ACS family hexuronate transporter-like MFS transporter n=1 Tax=Algibacter lectus TaxID=221126 RepID=A0A4R8MEH2_9FLAO|nr:MULTISPECIES: MFS transporter [Algibacter]MDO7136780.1 MFS transporter [Algibacter lectus]MWW24746.1 MFS transporter [Algibacter lectus]TDY62767.1 ACS family hexuronate transporter-like MFS transporter [Algibacter lectus]SFC90603.1 MFS transporter, ACS family, hexuronate transporter [Algibacter lectus]
MKVKGLRWWIISLICLATVINYIDRTAFGVMWPEMGKDLGMDESDYAIMLNVFMITYALGKFLSGKLYDIIGTRMGFTVSIVVWSVASIFHAFARGLVSLTLFRALLGLGEAGNWPGAVKSNGEWFPVKQRAIAQGIFNAGASLGSVIAPVLIAYLYGHFGWRTTFIIIGAIGLLWVIPWLFINKTTPETHPWITDEERNLIMNSRTEAIASVEVKKEKEKGLSVLQILSYKESWGVLASRFFIEPIWWLFVGWMPLYLHSKFGFSIAEIGSTIWISYLGGMAGSLIGGWYSGKLMETKTVDAARKITITIGCSLIFLGLLGIIFLVTEKNPMTFIYIVSVVLFGFQFAIGNIQTISSDLLRGPSVGTLAGLAGTVAAFSVIIMNTLIPLIAEVSYTPAFVVIAVLAPMAVLSIFILIRKIEQVEKIN